MNFQKTFPLARPVALVLGAILCSAPALAIQNGTDLTPSLVLKNPYNTTKTVEAWRQFGEADCSGVRISREWVMAAAHCGYSKNFSYLLDVNRKVDIDPATCSDASTFGYVYPNNDLHVCRLKDPSALPGPATYPPLAVLPADWWDTGKALGALMISGHSHLSTTPYQLALVDFQGMALADRAGNLYVDPVTNQTGLNAATVSRAMLQPQVVNGDSGGGAYWIPPNGQDAALVGIISSLRDGMMGVARVPWFFSDANMAALVNLIRTKGQPGDQIPTIRLSTDPYYKVPDTARPPAMMKAAPTVTSSGSASTLTATWSSPGGAVPINQFRLTVAQNGAVTSWTVSGAATSAALTDLTLSPQGRVCVTPVSDTGVEAISVYAKQAPTDYQLVYPVTPGCTDFNNVPPKAVQNLATTTAAAASGLIPMTTSWAAGDANAKSYRVELTTVSGTTKRVSVRDQTTTSVTSYLQPGLTLCAKVYARSSLGVLSNVASAACVLAK